MTASIRAGLVYFVCVFAVATGLGAIRVLFVAPALGPIPAVLIELPLLLGWSWFVAGRIPSARPFVMGATAFVVLMIAELSLFVLTNQGTAAAFLTRFRGLAELIGLLGQILFGLIPLLRRYRQTSAADKLAL